MRSNRTIPLTNKMNTALVQITETEFVELKISKSILKIDLTVEQIQALVENRLKKIIGAVDQLKINFKDNKDFLKKMREYEDAVNKFKTIFEFILQESGLNKDIDSNQEKLKFYDPNEEILRFITEADNEFQKFEYRYINFLVPQEEHETKKLKSLHDVIEDNLGGIKGLTFIIQDEVKRQRSYEQHQKEAEEARRKIVEDEQKEREKKLESAEKNNQTSILKAHLISQVRITDLEFSELKIPKPETEKDNITLTFQEIIILITNRINNAIEAITNLQSDMDLKIYPQLSGAIQELRTNIKDVFGNNFKGMLESINVNTYYSNATLLKFIEDTKKKFDINREYLETLVPSDQRSKLKPHLDNIHKILNGILTLNLGIDEKVQQQQKLVEETEKKERLRKREEETRQKEKEAKQKEDDERKAKVHALLEDVDEVKKQLSTNLEKLKEISSTKIDPLLSQVESLKSTKNLSDKAISDKTETDVEFTKLKSDINGYKVHLEAERTKQLEKFLILAKKDQMKKDLKKLSANDKNEYRKNVRALIDSIQQNSSFVDKLNVFCESAKDDDGHIIKNDTVLNWFNETQPDLKTKYETITEIDAKLKPAKTSDQIKSLNEWYDNNQKKLDFLEKRRGDNILLYVLNKIRKFLGKPEIKMGVAGVKVTTSMHAYFQPPEESSKKKSEVQITDNEPKNKTLK